MDEVDDGFNGLENICLGTAERAKPVVEVKHYLSSSKIIGLRCY